MLQTDQPHSQGCAAVPNSNEFGVAVARRYSTAAVSNVGPNTVKPNSKDKTNHPFSDNICH